MTTAISKSSLQRLPIYLNYLKSLGKAMPENISATSLAQQLGFGEVQVRKDLASITDAGKPKVGYLTADLINILQDYLGFHDYSDAVIVGVGRLGQALMAYKGFEDYGLKIVAGFDINEAIIGTKLSGKEIFPLNELEYIINRLGIKIGIITLPKENAQAVADLMVKAGIRAIWNFSPTHIKVAENIAIKNENMASSLAVLSSMLKEILEKEIN